ncbi:EAL domain-containing protein [Rhodocyclaceae bacterium SMB388]
MNTAPGAGGGKPSSEPFIADFSEGLEAGLYLALLELLDEGMIITGDEVVLEANSAACRLLERDYRDIAGKPLASLFPSERAFLDARARLFIQGEMRGSLQVALPAGRHRNLRFIAAARLRPGIHALILSPDVIADTYAHSSSEERGDSLWPRLAAVLEQPVIVIDGGGVITAANAPAVRSLGLAREDFVGRALASVFDIEWPEREGRQVAALRRPGLATAFSARVLPGPKPGWKLLVLPPTTGPTEGSGGDASDGGEAFDRAFADSPLPTFLCDSADMRILAANDAAVRGYGYPRERLCQLRMPQLSTDSETSPMTPGSGTWRYRRSDGRHFEADMLAYPVKLPSLPDTVVIMHDIPHSPTLGGRKPLPAAVIEAASRAIDRDQLDVHFQPLVDARTGLIRAGEALLRWHHPALGLIPFSRFMNLARSGGLLASMGDWVLDRACAHARTWPRRGDLQPGLTVNIALEQVVSGKLADRIRAVLDATGLTPQRLELDLDERILGEDRAHVPSTLSAIHALGVRLAIDDFGRGPASILKLKRYPLSALKLDPALVSDVGRCDQSKAVIEAIASMANVLGLDVLARGVKNSSQQACLSSLGCHLQQGPLYGPPLSAADFHALLTEAESCRRAGRSVLEPRAFRGTTVETVRGVQ